MVNEQIARYRQALLWAAGNPRATLPDPVGDLDLFLTLVDHHRLSGRLIRRLRREPRPSPQLVAAGTRLHQRTRAGVRRKLDTAAALGRAVRADGRAAEMVLLKGFSLYATTGDELDMRRSTDLDVVTSSLNGFVEAARDVGFRHVKEKDRLAEYAVMFAAKHGPVELHSRFDVTELHRGPDAELDPDSNPGIWEQRGEFSVHPMSVERLCADARRSPVLPEDVKILSPELSALVHAAHMHTDYVMHPQPLPAATVRLDEVATFVDLCLNPAFNTVRFASLADAFHGATAVRFACALASDLLDVELPVAPESDRRWQPKNLWWDGLSGGFPVDLGWQPQELVLREESLADVLGRLGSARLPLDDTGTARFSVFRFGAGSEPDRYIYRAEPGSEFSAEVELAQQRDGLRCTVDVPHIRESAMLGMSVNLNDNRYEVFYRPSDGRVSVGDFSPIPHADDHVSAWATRTSAGHRVELLAAPAKVLSSEGCVDALLALREQVVPWREVTAGAVVPLRVTGFSPTAA